MAAKGILTILMRTNYKLFFIIPHPDGKAEITNVTSFILEIMPVRRAEPEYLQTRYSLFEITLIKRPAPQQMDWMNIYTESWRTSY
jgi:hypothetical protein